MKFYAVTAVHLKGHIVGGGSVVVMMAIGAVVMMLCYMSAFGHDDSRNRQPWGIVVFTPLADPFDSGNHKRPDNQDEHKGKHDSEQTAPLYQTPNTYSFLLVSAFSQFFQKPVSYGTILL